MTLLSPPHPVKPLQKHMPILKLHLVPHESCKCRILIIFLGQLLNYFFSFYCIICVKGNIQNSVILSIHTPIANYSLSYTLFFYYKCINYIWYITYFLHLMWWLQKIDWDLLLPSSTLQLPISHIVERTGSEGYQALLSLILLFLFRVSWKR